MAEAVPVTVIVSESFNATVPSVTSVAVRSAAAPTVTGLL